MAQKIYTKKGDKGYTLAFIQKEEVEKTSQEAIDVKSLEIAMDDMSKSLEPLKNFILPGGNQLVCYCHVARTVCRKAERYVVEMSNKYTVSEEILETIWKSSK